LISAIVIVNKIKVRKRCHGSAMLKASLVELIRLAAAQNIDIEPLMREAIDICDPEGPFCS
jgi:hypothetical protein